MAKMLRKMPDKFKIEDFIAENGEIKLPKHDSFYQQMLKDQIS